MSQKLRNSLCILICAILVIFQAGCENDDSTDTDYNISADTTVVYITDSGTKYHRSSCSSLYNSKHKISLEKAIDKRYEACKRCKPPKS